MPEQKIIWQKKNKTSMGINVNSYFQVKRLGIYNVWTRKKFQQKQNYLLRGESEMVPSAIE